MSASTIALDEKTNALLTRLSEQTGLSPHRVLEEALDAYRRRLFFEGLSADYAALKADPAAWAEELAERR